MRLMTGYILQKKVLVNCNTAVETIPNEIREKTKIKNKETISRCWDNFKRPHVHVTGIPKREGAYKIFE